MITDLRLCDDNLFSQTPNHVGVNLFIHPQTQRRRSHRIIGGHKGRLGVWGTEVPQRGPGRSPCRESGGRKLKLFSETTHNICIKIQQTTVAVTLVDILNDITSKILGDITMEVPPFINIGGHVPLSHRDRCPCTDHRSNLAKLSTNADTPGDKVELPVERVRTGCDGAQLMTRSRLSDCWRYPARYRPPWNRRPSADTTQHQHFVYLCSDSAG